MNMRENISEDFYNTDQIVIPLGKIIEDILDKMKPVDYDHFLKLYEFMFSNLVWTLQPQPKGWNISTKYDLCGN